MVSSQSDTDRATQGATPQDHVVVVDDNVSTDHNGEASSHVQVNSSSDTDEEYIESQCTTVSRDRSSTSRTTRERDPVKSRMTPQDIKQELGLSTSQNVSVNERILNLMKQENLLGVIDFRIARDEVHKIKLRAMLQEVKKEFLDVFDVELEDARIDTLLWQKARYLNQKSKWPWSRQAEAKRQKQLELERTASASVAGSQDSMLGQSVAHLPPPSTAHKLEIGEAQMSNAHDGYIPEVDGGESQIPTPGQTSNVAMLMLLENSDTILQLELADNEARRKQLRNELIKMPLPDTTVKLAELHDRVNAITQERKDIKDRGKTLVDQMTDEEIREFQGSEKDLVRAMYCTVNSGPRGIKSKSSMIPGPPKSLMRECMS